jgi:GDP-D-mannose dehydratase
MKIPTLKNDVSAIMISKILIAFLTDLVLHYGDLTDSTNLTRILAQVKPDEIYNLAAQRQLLYNYHN